jgi:hypothetical protein
MSYHDYEDYEGPETPNAAAILFWTVVILCGIVGVITLIQTIKNAQQEPEQVQAQLVKQVGRTTVVGGCDETLWQHTYNSQRLQVIERCASVTGVTVDASHGKNKDGCRHEADGDLHCWLTLDVWPTDQSQFLSQGNQLHQDGNLVFEPECQHKVAQADAQAACKNWTQKLKLPPLGTRVRITGAAVLDTQHGHKEIHPVSSIEVLQK